MEGQRPQDNLKMAGLASQACRLLRLSSSKRFPQTAVSCHRFLHASHVQQSQPRMEVELTAPNGKKWMQPLGLFINNEFVKSSSNQKIESINPA